MGTFLFSYQFSSTKWTQNGGDDDDDDNAAAAHVNALK